MEDSEFNDLWDSLHKLHSLGVCVVCFEKQYEYKIKKGIEERYGENKMSPKLYLRNIEIIFI